LWSLIVASNGRFLIGFFTNFNPCDTWKEGVGEEGRRSQSLIQMPEEELVDIKFRLYDGSDMGPFRYSSASTVDMLKQRVVSDWPKGKTIIPKVANEVKLISSGKILENNKTVGQCKMPFGDNAGGVIIMHVVVQPSLAKTKTEKKIDDSPRKIVCSCSIL